MNASSADTRTAPIHHDLTAQERAVLIATTSERLEAHFRRVNTKILRFPRGLRGIGGENDRYIAPSVVSIGPYHRGSPHLQKMEEVKHAAAHYLICRYSHSSVEEVYKRVLSVVSEVRQCYDTDDRSVSGTGDADFAAMMFHDGCFLLLYMIGSEEVELSLFRGTQSSGSGTSIMKDMLLLENQIPWLVIETLTVFLDVDACRLVAKMGEKFFPSKLSPPTERHLYDYKPPHLLGLHRYCQIGSLHHLRQSWVGCSLSLSRSATELSQIGIKLTATTDTGFGHMSIKKKLVFGELSCSPLFLNDVTACSLVNMAALEATAIPSQSDSDGYVVTSYLLVLAMLMDREEDVHKLRGKGVLRSIFSNTQTLSFFKGLSQHLEPGDGYFVILEEFGGYMRHRWLRIAVHRFIYKNFKVMVKVLSIAGVLAGIFKALYSLKKL